MFLQWDYFPTIKCWYVWVTSSAKKSICLFCLRQQLYIEEVPWDTSTCLSQRASQNITGCTSLEECTNSPYSLTATPRTHAVSSFQSPMFQSQNISSKQGREYTPPPSLIRKECATLSRVSDNSLDTYFQFFLYFHLLLFISK